ncbi:hypothetical protein DYB37_011193 [Aphanomyces astaci]|uniref:Uncharacterized protein n=1 Tax=Aphanomyces astaci TaxID=112090 RepID=A0A418F536_APHAT|nr:hypothetical protein DYB37_011193 [Aphanomyces astaci]
MESTNRDLLQSIYEFEWGIEPKDLTEYQYRCKIMDIIEAPPTKWTPKKADMEKYFQYLKMDKQGDVTSRLVTFMANVKRAVDKNGIERHLESDLMMKTFIKVVASKITPADLRFRVEENMRTVKVEDLKAFAKILKQQLERSSNVNNTPLRRSAAVMTTSQKGYTDAEASSMPRKMATTSAEAKTSTAPVPRSGAIVTANKASPNVKTTCVHRGGENSRPVGPAGQAVPQPEQDLAEGDCRRDGR